MPSKCECGSASWLEGKCITCGKPNPRPAAPPRPHPRYVGMNTDGSVRYIAPSENLSPRTLLDGYNAMSTAGELTYPISISGSAATDIRINISVHPRTSMLSLSRYVEATLEVRGKQALHIAHNLSEETLRERTEDQQRELWRAVKFKMVVELVREALEKGYIRVEEVYDERLSPF